MNCLVYGLGPLLCRSVFIPYLTSVPCVPLTLGQGDIFGRATLDYETVPVHFLGVAAIDQASDPRDRMTSTCMVTVTLRDINDNRPSFSSAVYESSVLENSTQGVVVTQVSATDLDSGVNGDIFYSFQSPIS